MASGARWSFDSLDAAVNLDKEDAPHVPQTRCCQFAGELNGTSRQHLDHVAVVVIFFRLHQRSM